MKLVQTKLAIITMLSLAFTPLAAQDYSDGATFDRGLAAYEAGDYATARQEWTISAGWGDAKAQYRVGFLYYSGKGVAQNYAESAKWFRRAALQGHTDAQFLLGNSYSTGRGVPLNNITAHMWFDIAANFGHNGARLSRDIVALQMTPFDIGGAIIDARNCVRTSYTRCDW